MSLFRPPYCGLLDVTKRMYPGGASPSTPTNSARDLVITDLIQQLSRRFDIETGRPPGGFAPLYSRRLFSGQGRQVLEVDEFGVITKIEVNLTPGVSPVTWTDVTTDMANGQLVARPLRRWPKTELFRMQTFYVDPYQNGNWRLTGVWGCIQPDLGASTPTLDGTQNPPIINDGGSFQGFTAAQITAAQPINPTTGSGQGWWIVPEDVTKAIAEWAVKSLKSAEAGYADIAGNPSGGAVMLRKDIPDEVRNVIDSYTRSRPHLAMIGLDGTDFWDEQAYPGAVDEPVSRWAGWQNYPVGP